MNQIGIRKKKTAIILPDSTMDNGHERELDCNDTAGETKNIHQWSDRTDFQTRKKGRLPEWMVLPGTRAARTDT